MEAYVKTTSSGDLRDEAAALNWLAEATPAGGIRVAHVLEAEPHRLVLERINQINPSPQAAARIGKGLAHMHAAGARWWGAPPPAMKAPGYVINGTLTEVVTEETAAQPTWGAYFAQVRIEPFVEQLSAQGFFSAAEQQTFEALCKRLRAGDFNAPQPALLPPDAPARLHGDLWAGNVIFSQDPQTAEASGALIDPMAHGGHAETDLAMLQLFGHPYLDEVLAAYNKESPLAPGWQNRVALHQLAPLLHHCLLFGASYKAQTLIAAARYLD